MRLPRVFVVALLAGLCWVRPGAQVFRSQVDLVSFGVTVVDRKGGLVSDLTAEDFDLVEDGARQSLSLFARGNRAESRPDLHLGLLFDTSGSMDDDIHFARGAAIKFLNALPEAEDVTLVDFDTEVRVARYGQNDFARLVERIRHRRPDGMTAFYDAIGVYLDGAAFQDGRKILVVYTDGADTESTMGFSEMVDLLKASDITLYAVGFLEHVPRSVVMELRLRLIRLAEMTGGQAYFPVVAKDLDRSYDEVLAEIRAQYTLGYVSTNRKPDGTWRKVRITVKRPSLKVRAREGYFAPYRERP
ncbi:MAG: VWA domain-containing protein [Acidobacteriota bacterium]